MIKSLQPKTIDQASFVELLSAEFVSAKGYGVHAFLAYNDIEALYRHFLNETLSPTIFVRIFVKRFSYAE